MEKENLTQLTLLDADSIASYMERQALPGTLENHVPLHITTNLGITHELQTPGKIIRRLGSVDGDFAASLEIYVPSIETIESSDRSAVGQLVRELDATAQKRSKGTLRGNARDIHGNVWIELFLVIKGELTFVEFNPSDEEMKTMRENDGSLYRLGNVEAVRNAHKDATVTRLKPGDLYLSPPGVAHGVFDAIDAVYIVFIFKGKDFIEWMKLFWGEDSRKFKLNMNIDGGHNELQSYWGQFSQKNSQ